MDENMHVGSSEARSRKSDIANPSGKHILPKLPTMKGPSRIVQSKASAKDMKDRIVEVNVVEDDCIPLEDVLAMESIMGEGEPCESTVTLLKPDADLPSGEAGDESTADVNKIITSTEETGGWAPDAVELPAPLRRTRRSVSRQSNDSPPPQESKQDEILTDTGKANQGTQQTSNSGLGPSVPADGPSGDKKQKNGQQLSHVQTEQRAKWLVGDLVWGKVSGHPWWPCMVSHDPLQSIHTKMTTDRGVPKRLYHVQYFGHRPEHGWIRETATIEFCGRESFEEQMKNHNVPKHARGKKNIFEVSDAKKPSWEMAIEEAAAALKLSRPERKHQLTFHYLPPKKKGAAFRVTTNKDNRETIKRSGRKSTGSIPSSDRPSKGPRTKIKSQGDLINGLLLKKMNRKSEPLVTTSSSVAKASSGVVISSDFDVYYEKNVKRVRDEHPDFPDEKIKEYLQCHWISLSTDQKKEYKGTFILEDHGGRRLSARVKKPSKRVLEAVEDIVMQEEVSEKKKKSEKSPVQKDHPPAKKTGLKKQVDSKIDSIDEVFNCVLYGDDHEMQNKPSEVVGKKKRGRKRKVAEVDAALAETAEKPKKRRKKMHERGLSDGKKGESGNTRVVGRPKKRRKKVAADDVEGLAHEKVKVEVSDSDGNVKRRGKLKEEEVSESEGSIVRKGKVKEEVSENENIPRKKGNKVNTEVAETEVDPQDFEENDHDTNKTGGLKNGKVCQICEKPDDLIQCKDLCLASFHASCLGLTELPVADFQCKDCLSGVHKCFVCKETSRDLRRCSVATCGKFYHEECIKKWPLARVEGKALICPLHGCATCNANNSKSAKVNRGRLIRCVRCPTAFHNSGDQCVAAGSQFLSGCNIICSRHFQPDKNKNHHAHVNVSWCFLCSKGGTLLCCESCPAAFHADCLNIQFPEGSWFCKDCTIGRRPLYDDVVWVKLGNYRWWPALVRNPKLVPKNIQEMPHQVGEFPVYFFGSKDYYWTHQARVFLFQDGDKGSRETANSKRLEKVFQRAIQEATEAFQSWKQAKESKMQQITIRIEKKPAHYKFVKTNVPVGSVQINKADLSEIARCECTEDLACSSDTDCFNRMLMYECHPAVCPAGEKCQNQRFQKRQYPDSVPYRTSERGWGLKTLVDIRKGQFVNEYVGELIDEEECRKRIKKAHEDNVSNFYMLTLDKNRVIDAGPKGNLSRFMNHSCQPNCVTQKWNVNGDVRVGLFAICEIPAGSELTFNYNLDCLGNDKTACQCGADLCSGFLGVPPKTAMSRSAPKEIRKKKKRKKHIHQPKHEDDCFRCGEGGRLVMCDLAGCTKAYHMDCLTLDKLPYGKWICPWHHCDVCGKKAVKLCVECPNSFCLNHIEDQIREMSDGKNFCHEHADIYAAYESGIMGSSTSSTSSEDDTAAEDTCGEVTEVEATKAVSSVEVTSDEPPSTDAEKKHLNHMGSGQGNLPASGMGSSTTKMKRPNSLKAADKKSNTKLKTKQLQKEKLAAKKKLVKKTASGRSRSNKKVKNVGTKKRSANGAVNNNNDEKCGDTCDFPTTDDDEFPSLVIDIPGCS